MGFTLNCDTPVPTCGVSHGSVRLFVGAMTEDLSINRHGGLFLSFDLSKLNSFGHYTI